MNLKKLNYRSYSSTGRANPWKEQNYADFFQGLMKVRVLLRPQTNTEKEARTANSRFAKAGVSCFYDSEVLNSSFVHLLKFSAEKPRPSQICKTLCAILKDKPY